MDKSIFLDSVFRKTSLHPLVYYLVLVLSSLCVTVTFCEAQQQGVWECLPNSCEIPIEYKEKPKSHEVEADRKFELRVQKRLAKEPQKFDRLGKENNRELDLDNRKRGHFSAFSFPNNGN